MIGWWVLLTAAFAEGTGRPLTYREALEGALARNPSLRRAALDREAAEGSLVSARGIFDPRLGVDGNWRQSRSRGFFQGFPFESESRSWDLGSNVSGTLGTGTSYALNASLDRNFSSFKTNFGPVTSDEQIQDAYTSNVNVSLTQQLLEGLRMSYNLQNVTRARQGLATAELNLEKARQDALSQTAQAYWTWAYQERLLEIADQSVAVADEALRVGQLRVDAGDLAPVERTRLEAAAVQAKTQRMDAETAARQAADNLLLLIGGTPGEAIVPATAPGEVGGLELDPDKAVEVARMQNLDLQVARSEMDLAETDLKNARHEVLPSLAATLSTGIGAQDESAGAAVSGLLDEDAFPFLSVGGSLDVPLGNRAARGQVTTRKVAVEQRKLAVTDLEANVAAQVRQQVRVLQTAARRVELADANLRLAEETLAAEEALVDAGRSIQRDVLEARAEVDRSRAEAAKARTDHRLAQVELLRLQGQLTEDVP